MRFLLSFFLLLSYCLAQSLNIFVDKNKIDSGELLTLSVELFGSNDFPKVILDPLYKDFDVISGPSQQTNIQWINGKMTNAKTLSWKLLPKRTGILVIPSMQVTTGNKVFSGNKIEIQVGNISSSDEEKVFIIGEIDKDNAFLGEQITLSYQLYKRVDVSISGIDQFKMPEFKGFWVEEIFTPQRLQYKSQLVNINGVNYQVANLGQRALFPMPSSLHRIPSVNVRVKIEVKKKKRRRDPFFDPFFDSFFSETKTRIINSKEKNITINLFPEPRPFDFTGAVGDFAIKTSVDTNAIVANNGISYTITLTGTGNIGLFSLPQINFPSDIEAFPPTESINKDGFRNQITGEKKWEYILIPRKAGQITLPNVQMSFFNSTKKEWKRLKTKPIIIDVKKNDKKLIYDEGLTKREVELLGQDIRFIRTEDSDLKNKSILDIYIVIIIYFISLLIIIVPVIIIRFTGHRLATEQSRRMRKALRKSIKLLNNPNLNDPYELASTSCYIYMQDKLNLSNKNLDISLVKSILHQKINLELYARLIDLLVICDEAKFSPIAKGEDIDPIKEMKTILILIDKELK